MERPSIVVLLCLSLTGIATGQGTLPVCTEIGVYEINDGTCRNCYICVDNGVNLVPVLVSCAASAIFDPVLGRCVPETTATCLQTTTPPPTTVTPPCFRYGRFRIPDPNCKMYYLCYWDGTGYTIMDNLTCSSTLVFEPVSEKCVLPERYICPGI